MGDSDTKLSSEGCQLCRRGPSTSSVSWNHQLACEDVLSWLVRFLVLSVFESVKAVHFGGIEVAHVMSRVLSEGLETTATPRFAKDIYQTRGTLI